MKVLASITSLLFFFLFASAQDKSLQGWQLDDPKTSGHYGISLNEAYNFLRENKLTGSPVIVAILDDGIDTSHEDLHNVLWINQKEIPGNGVDDDGNGYKDE